MNLEDKIEYHMVTDAFVIVAFVVDNDDDETDLVQILFQLIHEYAKLNFIFFSIEISNSFKIFLQCPLPFVPRPALTKQSFNDKLCLTLFFQDLLTSSAKYRYLY
jgi:hypothetical protein